MLLNKYGGDMNILDDLGHTPLAYTKEKII